MSAPKRPGVLPNPVDHASQIPVVSAPHSPSRAYAIYVLSLLAAANVLSYADRYLFSIAMPSIKTEFGISDGMLGLIAGPGFTISYLLFTIPLARLADRWSRRCVVAISAALWSVATGLSGLATGIVQLTVTRILVGIGEAGCMPPAQSMISQLFDARYRSTALGFLAAGPYVGLVLGLAGGGAMASMWGWRAAFLVMALLGLPIALLVWLTGPKRQPRTGSEDPTLPAVSTWVALRHCWAIPSLRLIAWGTGVFTIFGQAGGIWFPTLLIRSHGMTAAEAGFWLGICATIGGVVGSLSSGAIVDVLARRDQRWQLRVPALGFLLTFPIFVVILTLPAGLWVPLLGLKVPLVGLLMMVGAFLSALWMGPSFSAVSRLVAPDRRAQATAMLVVVINVVGSAGGPLIAGFVSDALAVRFENEALRYTLLSMSVLTLLGGLVFWRASSHYLRDLAAAERDVGRSHSIPLKIATVTHPMATVPDRI